MKKFALLFAVGFAMVSCGGKSSGWDAAAEKKYMDGCNIGGAMTSLCDCNMKAYKAANVAPDKIQSTTDAAVVAELAKCAMSGIGGGIENIGNMINSAITTTLPTDTAKTHTTGH